MTRDDLDYRRLPLPRFSEPVCAQRAFMPPRRAGSVRRARRIDVWREPAVLSHACRVLRPGAATGTIRIDSGFQDSALVFDGTRVAVHEYALRAVSDAASLKLLSVDASPAILPYAECRAAPVNLAALIGAPLGDLREIVLEWLAKSAGCTHLNDMTRALAEVPVLAECLPTD